MAHARVGLLRVGSEAYVRTTGVHVSVSETRGVGNAEKLRLRYSRPSDWPRWDDQI